MSIPDLDKLYQPLAPEQIRILKLVASSHHEPIRSLLLRATLVEVEGIRLDEEWHERSIVPFTALSYSWGRPAATNSVLCNGCDFPITTQLEDAFLAMRLENEDRYIWTDAFCINQNDLEEKAKQVELMFRLFQKAHVVFCWLGRAQPEHERMLRYLADYKAQKALLHASTLELCLSMLNEKDSQALAPRLKEYFWEWELDDQWIAKLTKEVEDIQEKLPILTSSAVDFATSCDWFQRTWIRQEAFVARNLEVVCGRYQIDLDTLGRLITAAKDTSQLLEPFKNVLVFLMKYSRDSGHSSVDSNSNGNLSRYIIKKSTISRNWRALPFLDLVVSNTSGFKASNDLDRIYALQNMAKALASPEPQPMLTVDYLRQPLDVYAEFAKRTMNQYGPIRLLSLLDQRQSLDPAQWPTWLPDFRQNVPRIWLRPYLDAPHNATFREKTGIDFLRSDKMQLPVQGIRIGIVGKPINTTDDILWKDFFDKDLADGLRFPAIAYGLSAGYNKDTLLNTMQYRFSYFHRSDQACECLYTSFGAKISAVIPETEKILAAAPVREGDIVVLLGHYLKRATSPISTGPPYDLLEWNFRSMWNSQPVLRGRMGTIELVSDCDGRVAWILRPVDTGPETKFTFLGPAFILTFATERVEEQRNLGQRKMGRDHHATGPDKDRWNPAKYTTVDDEGGNSTTIKQFVRSTTFPMRRMPNDIEGFFETFVLV